MKRYDAAVIGLGGMGSAAAAHLARRGARVIGFDRHPLMHELGASAGRTRIIRKAYFEDLAYVPLLQRAYELWRELEHTTAQPLLDLCGMLVVGSGEANVARGVLRASEEYAIPVEIMNAAEVRRSYPQLRPLDTEIGVFEPEAGIVFPERAIEAHINVALAHGAVLEGNTRVTGWRDDAGSLVIQVDGRDTYEVDRVIVCAGPWIPSAFAALGLPIRVQRNVQYWFEPLTSEFERGRFPAFFLDRDGLAAPLYGFPDLGEGIKVAFHALGDITTADTLNREVSDAEVAAVKRTLRDWMPDAAGDLISVKACMYAMTPDQHFLIGADPHDRRVIVAGGFSGHGFKFVPVIGEILAQLALDGVTTLDIGFLSPTRFLEGVR